MLTNKEIKQIEDALGRAPNLTETHVFDATVSYTHLRAHET